MIDTIRRINPCD